MDAAESLGDVVYLFDSQYEITPLMGQKAVEAIAQKLNDIGYNPHSDAIALTGPVALVAMLLVAAVSFNRQGFITAMVFDARCGGTYKMRDITMPGVNQP